MRADVQRRLLCSPASHGQCRERLLRQGQRGSMRQDAQSGHAACCSSRAFSRL